MSAEPAAVEQPSQAVPPIKRVRARETWLVEDPEPTEDRALVF